MADECPVCFEELIIADSVSLECKHNFCKECVSERITNDLCPMRRCPSEIIKKHKKAVSTQPSMNAVSEHPNMSEEEVKEKFEPEKEIVSKTSKQGKISMRHLAEYLKSYGDTDSISIKDSFQDGVTREEVIDMVNDYYGKNNDWYSEHEKFQKEMSEVGKKNIYDVYDKYNYINYSIKYGYPINNIPYNLIDTYIKYKQ